MRNSHTGASSECEKSGCIEHMNHDRDKDQVRLSCAHNGALNILKSHMQLLM